MRLDQEYQPFDKVLFEQIKGLTKKSKSTKQVVQDEGIILDWVEL